jgi:hypothetical protein
VSHRQPGTASLPRESAPGGVQTRS